ncbi:MAG: phage capsid protein, partial [Candidatus Heimdallarchaeaceae archaeon]
MSTQITTAFVNQFHRGFELLLQQEGSKLRPYVDVRKQVGEYGYYDFIGAVSAQDLSERHASTTFINTPHSRRRVGLATKFLADLIDEKDKVKMLGDPKNDYAMNFAHAMGRAIDQAIVTAAFGSAYAGKAGGTTVTYASSGTTITEAGSAGLTVAKIREASTKLNLNNVPNSERYFIVTANQIDDLLGIN